MLEGIEALVALENTGTISEAAAQLRLTQSAVSKRIQSLQNELKFQLLEPVGRKVRITQSGMQFLEKAKPLFAELKNLGSLRSDFEMNHFTLGMADSVAASWGPRLIRRVTKALPAVDFSLHVHRGVLVQEHVKLGRYHFGLCTALEADSSLISFGIASEQMVLIPSGLKPRSTANEKIITIERGSSTWASVGSQVSKHPRFSKHEFLYVESFSAAVQMAREGFGNALVPKGLAEAVGISEKAMHTLNPSIKREIRLVCRKTISLLPVVNEIVAQLKMNSREIIQ